MHHTGTGHTEACSVERPSLCSHSAYDKDRLRRGLAQVEDDPHGSRDSYLVTVMHEAQLVKDYESLRAWRSAGGRFPIDGSWQETVQARAIAALRSEIGAVQSLPALAVQGGHFPLVAVAPAPAVALSAPAVPPPAPPAPAAPASLVMATAPMVTGSDGPPDEGPSAAVAPAPLATQAAPVLLSGAAVPPVVVSGPRGHCGVGDGVGDGAGDGVEVTSKARPSLDDMLTDRDFRILRRLLWPDDTESNYIVGALHFMRCRSMLFVVTSHPEWLYDATVQLQIEADGRSSRVLDTDFRNAPNATEIRVLTKDEVVTRAGQVACAFRSEHALQ